jgi:hypothetical protein
MADSVSTTSPAIRNASPVQPHSPASCSSVSISAGCSRVPRAMRVQ